MNDLTLTMKPWVSSTKTVGLHHSQAISEGDFEVVALEEEGMCRLCQIESDQVSSELSEWRLVMAEVDLLPRGLRG